MEVTDFLTLNKITLEDVIAHVNATVHLTPGDVLFVSGSLVEGLGNEESDLDLFLITSRNDIQFTSLNDVTVIVNDCLIDIRVVQQSGIEELIRRFGRWAGLPRHPRGAFEFTEDERKFLHRLRIGNPLYGAADFERLLGRLDPRDLSRHKLDWARHLASTIQVDLAGLYKARDQYTMLFASQELLGHTIDGLLAAYGYTNPNQKWRVRMLAGLPADWERKLPGAGTGMSPVERFLALHRMPQSESLNDMFEHALRVVAFSRCVFPWAELTLFGPPELSLPLDAVAPQADREAGQPLPHLDLNVEIRYAAGRFEVLRLNEQGPTFELSPQAYLLFCLFDGVTSSVSAADYAEKLGLEKNGLETIGELMAMVRYAGLEADTIIDEQALRAVLRH